MDIQTDRDICQSCGACCATWPVIFINLQSVPVDKCINTYKDIYTMKATDLRCDCLSGEIGIKTKCKIYEHRSSVCSNFLIRSSRCNEARLTHNLNPL